MTNELVMREEMGSERKDTGKGSERMNGSAGRDGKQRGVGERKEEERTQTEEEIVTMGVLLLLFCNHILNPIKIFHFHTAGLISSNIAHSLCK